MKTCKGIAEKVLNIRPKELVSGATCWSGEDEI